MTQSSTLIPSARQLLYDRMASKMETANHLSRKVVSFQANKDEPIYRWFKYKEGFSSALVKYFLGEYGNKPGRLLDPFAGAGTTLFAGQELGWQSLGIELLPVGAFVMQAREALNGIDTDKLRRIVKKTWTEISQIEHYVNHIKHITITKDAFPDETERQLNKFLAFCATIEDEKIQTVMRFAAFAVLEDISYTRKDGQYLRWDYRSNRELSGKPFDKGKILTFEEALKHKLNQILVDLLPGQSINLFEQLDSNRHSTIEQNPVSIIEGSCLEELPKLESDAFDFIVTSPPYCNRYDYTRTYALELVFWDKIAIR
ncbi:MAG: hypothetical protein KF852_05405 [Saprospiraceae bacterium]|nr:hypothetical protein [Saprospiraceae bacterium]